MPLPLKRHVFTTDLLGTRVQRHWNTSLQTRRCYYTSSFCRLTKPESTCGIADRGGHMFQDLPGGDETAQYIKIKDNLYLFSLVEEYMERALQDREPPFRSNDMKFLQNYDRMYHVGRTLVDIKGYGPYYSDAPCTLERCIYLQDYEHMMTAGIVFAGGETPVMVSGFAKFMDVEEEETDVNRVAGAS